MNFVAPPKFLCWPKTNSIEQQYICQFDLAITSGCSFTGSTVWFDGAASWPGYMRDRCGLPSVIDMSFPGKGNRYIADGVKHMVHYAQKTYTTDKILVVVMWSGLDRLDRPRLANSHEISAKCHPIIGDQFYERPSSNFNQEHQRAATLESRDIILELACWLSDRDIKWCFTSYANLLYPPYVPKRDTTWHFTDHCQDDELTELRSILNVPCHGLDYLFEWAWRHNQLNKDQFHPSNQAHLAWTDQVLLPACETKGLISRK